MSARFGIQNVQKATRIFKTAHGNASIPIELQRNDEARANQPKWQVAHVEKKGHLKRKVAHATVLGQTQVNEVSFRVV